MQWTHLNIYLNKNNKSISDAEIIPVDTAIGVNTAPATVWEYTTEEDKMTSNVKYFALTKSINTLHFGFPYEGGTTGGLLIRNWKNKNEVILTITQGQFTSTYGHEYVRVRFDDDQP